MYRVDDAAKAVLRQEGVSRVVFLYFSQVLLFTAGSWRRKRLLRGVVDRASYLFADGMAIRLLVGRILRNIGVRYPGGALAIPGVNGTDLLPAFFRACEADGRQFDLILFGGKAGVANRASQGIAAPCFATIQCFDGYSDFNLWAHVRSMECEGRPVVILIGLGSPFQEEILLSMPVGLPQRDMFVFLVGGLFDFMSGDERRAPVLIRRAHCEWIWRALVNPGKNLRKAARNTWFLYFFLFKYKSRFLEVIARKMNASAWSVERW